jgi:hypothetical protein
MFLPLTCDKALIARKILILIELVVDLSSKDIYDLLKSNLTDHRIVVCTNNQSTTMASGRTLKLNSGYTMPVLGLGTWVR